MQRQPGREGAGPVGASNFETASASFGGIRLCTATTDTRQAVPSVLALCVENLIRRRHSSQATHLFASVSRLVRAGWLQKLRIIRFGMVTTLVINAELPNISGGNLRRCAAHFPFVGTEEKIKYKGQFYLHGATPGTFHAKLWPQLPRQACTIPTTSDLRDQK